MRYLYTWIREMALKLHQSSHPVYSLFFPSTSFSVPDGYSGYYFKTLIHNPCV